MTYHYVVKPDQRQQLNGGRYFSTGAPLCNTGDGHYSGDNPADWNGSGPAITCARCCNRKHLLSRRDRELAVWQSEGALEVHRTRNLSIFVVKRKSNGKTRTFCAPNAEERAIEYAEEGESE